jgi:hypothetical protein
MAEMNGAKRTRSQEIISERLAPKPDGTVNHPWPNGAHLIAADEHWAGRAVVRAARAGDPAVLFFPDGEEVLLTPTKPVE